MGVVGLNAKMGHRDHVAVLVMVIMIAMIMQLPSTSHCMMMNNQSSTISINSTAAGNATWCDGHISIDGECLNLNIKGNTNIEDDDEEDMELKYAMVDMVDFYSETTTFITRFLGNNGNSAAQKAVENANKAYCERPDALYERCHDKENKGHKENCSVYKKECHLPSE